MSGKEWFLRLEKQRERDNAVCTARSATVFVLSYILDRVRVVTVGYTGEYLEQYMPWHIYEQLLRTHRAEPWTVFAPYRIEDYARGLQPNYGLIVHRIDSEIWKWFVREAKEITWVAPNAEPQSYHTDEYLEINNIVLRGDLCAWAHFEGTWLTMTWI